MIVMNEPYPESCLVCPVRQKIGCSVADNSGVFEGVFEGIPFGCPFEPAESVSTTEVVEEITREVVQEVEESSGGFEVAELICLMCLKRFIDVRPVGILLKNLECLGCHKTGYIIETGEYMTENNDSN